VVAAHHSVLAAPAAPTRPDIPPVRDLFRVVVGNTEYGGVSRATLSRAKAEEQAGVRAGLHADLALLQEIDCGGNPQNVIRHLRWLAREAGGMQPVLGPSAALRSGTGNHTGMLVAPWVGILSEWPGITGPQERYTTAVLDVPGLGELVACSAHAPARSGTWAAITGELAASFLGQESERGAWVIGGGDWNGYARAGCPGRYVLEELPPRLKAARCLTDQDGGLWPDLRCDDAFARAGLADLGAEAAGRLGDLTALEPTGRGGARCDRAYAGGGPGGLAGLPAALLSQRRLRGLGDHEWVVFDFDRAAAVRTAG
jgi:hypothetical protein